MSKKCEYIFKKGVHKGEKCDKDSELDSLFCIAHTNQMKNLQLETLIRQKNKEEDDIKNKILQLSTNFENKLVIYKHYENIKRLDSSSTEYYKNMMFINSALSIPWNKYYDINSAIDGVDISYFIKTIQEEFDKQIYGMDSVKSEIINYICKFITNPKSTRNNIALYGPAGVAKSKFIHVLGSVLGIPVKTIALGGVKDAAFFLGHGYVYVESGPGKIIQNIIDSKIMNPILYFDELDKVSEAETGKDIYSFLTYLTDPTQNTNFSEHYFYGMSFDLSKTFYVFTFNDITKIDRVLLDRLNVIYVPTPTKSEKIFILEKYCLPEMMSNIGVTKNIQFEQECFHKIIDFTERTIDLNVSSGIRESYRILEKIILQINKDILLKKFREKDKKIIIDLKQFNEYFKLIELQVRQSDIDNISHLFMYT